MQKVEMEKIEIKLAGEEMRNKKTWLHNRYRCIRKGQQVAHQRSVALNLE
jgi:hypothetical protein